MNVKTSLSLHSDAPILLEFVLKKDKAWLFAHPECELTDRQEAKFKKLIQKRHRHWPAAYLLGHKEFFGLDFLVNKNTLIPRPETEFIVELALSHLFSPSRREGGDEEEVRVVDVGTGSGNIIVSIAKFLFSVSPLARRDAPSEVEGQRGRTAFFATDSSAKALQIARRNARRHDVLNKIKFLHSSLFSPLQRGRLRGGKYLIVANLPYLTPAQLRVNPNLKHEPRGALVAGPDGLKYYRELFQQVSSLSPRGRGIKGEGVTLLLEHDPSQVTKLKKLARQFFPAGKSKFHRDLADNWRVMEIQI